MKRITIYVAILLISKMLFAQNYPPDLTSNITWSAGTSGVSDVQTAFNNARTNENIQLGTVLPMLTFPSQVEWDAKTDGQKALWIINKERADRSVKIMDSVEANVTSVAQNYAQYLIDNDTNGHYADGRTPKERLNVNAEIVACSDFLNVAENLSVFAASSLAGNSLPVERSIYNCMYSDASSSWGHRQTILWYPYNDNSGTANREGFLGIGKAMGTNSSQFPQPNYVTRVVLNVFDPCSTWNYTSVPSVESESLEINVYPNPASQTLTIQISDNAVNNVDMSILNTQGQVLYNVTQTGNDDIKVDVSSYAKGLYFVKINYLKSNSETIYKSYKISVL